MYQNTFHKAASRRDKTQVSSKLSVWKHYIAHTAGAVYNMN